MCCSSRFHSVIFGFVIIVDLVVGLICNFTAAFFGNGILVWGYILFGGYSLFALFIVVFTYRQVSSDNETSSALNWICGMCTVVTVIAIIAVFFLVKPKTNTEAIYVCLVVLSISMMLLSCTADCYNCMLMLGLVDAKKPSQNVIYTPTAAAGEPSNPEGGKSLEQSLAQMVNHVQNNPAQKSYTLYAPGSGTPFSVTV